MTLTGAPAIKTLELTLETPQEEAARLGEKLKGVADQLAEANASGDPAVVAKVEDALAEKYNIPGEKPSDKVTLETNPAPSASPLEVLENKRQELMAELKAEKEKGEPAKNELRDKEFKLETEVNEAFKKRDERTLLEKKAELEEVRVLIDAIQSSSKVESIRAELKETRLKIAETEIADRIALRKTPARSIEGISKLLLIKNNEPYRGVGGFYGSGTELILDVQTVMGSDLSQSEKLKIVEHLGNLIQSDTLGSQAGELYDSYKDKLKSTIQ